MLEINEGTVMVDVSAPDAEAVIRALADRLHAQGLVGESYAADTIDRERAHPTGLPTKPFSIAFPHADADGVHQSALAVAALRQPVVFQNMAEPDEALDVHLVFLLANNSPEEQVQTLRNLAQLFSQPDKLAALRGQSAAKDIVAWLKRELCLDEDGAEPTGPQKGGSQRDAT